MLDELDADSLLSAHLADKVEDITCTLRQISWRDTNRAKSTTGEQPLVPPRSVILELNGEEY